LYYFDPHVLTFNIKFCFVPSLLSCVPAPYFPIFIFQKTRWSNHDLVTVYRDYVKSINPQNLSLFIEAYLR